MSAPPLSLAAIGQPAFLYGPERRIAETNDLAESLANRPLVGCTAADVVAIFGHCRLDGTSLAPSELPACRALAGEEVVDLPFTVTASDGRTLHILATASPVRDRGRIVGALTIWHDVTAGERLRQELAESEAKYRNLVELAPDAILIHQDRVIVFANPAAVALIGVRGAEDLVGLPVLDIVHPETRQRVEWNIMADLRGERSPLTTVDLLRPDGTTITIQGRGAMIPFRGHPAIQVVLRDITDEKRAENALRESEERLRLAKDCGRIGIWEWFPPAVGGANPLDSLRIYDDTLPEIRQLDDWRSVVHPDDLARVEADLDAAVVRREPIELEFRYDSGSGTFRWLRALGDGVFDEAGRLLRVIGVHTDITDQKRAEAVLRESEAKYRRLVDDDITGHVIVTPDGRILDCNPAFARIFGFASVEEARSSNMVETYGTPAEREARVARLRTERRIENDEGFRRRRDGTRIHIVENIIGDFDDAGELVQIRGYISDDTQRYRAEEGVRDRERTLQSIFRSAPIGIGMLSCRRITQANDHLCRLTGYAENELIGQDVRLLYTDDEAYAYVGREIYGQIEANGTGIVENQLRTKDGAVIDILLSASPADPSRPHEDVIFNTLDITRLRESERALASYMDDLQRSNEELQRFAYVASHDLQEPLRSIISFSQLLERRYRGRLDQDADEYIQFIVEGGNRMQRLIMDLLQLSRVETMAKPLSPTDAGEVVADALRLLETPTREAGATVTVEELPTVMADASQLQQVFTNLVGNALKYRRPDVPPTIRIAAEPAGAFWRFTVEDNGIGIEAEYFDRIFVIFQRLHTRDEYEGTGIGLALARRIVERHGGRIGIESTPGEGSTFFFTLPTA